MNTVAISGNTYPVKEALKALGARWNADGKAWMVPADKADEARALVAGAPARGNGPVVRNGVMYARSRSTGTARNHGLNTHECALCGETLNSRYETCWECGNGNGGNGRERY